MEIEIAQVHVGTPQQLGPAELGIVSSIAKRRVDRGTLELSTINLSGDDQSDRSVHGGADKAVYAHPSEHLATWEHDLGQTGLVGSPIAPFGENVSTRGATEAEVCIGDVWAWGDARLQVAQPRWPCQKLTVHRGTPKVGAIMRASGRTGWYLRVLEPGSVPVDASISIVERHPGRVTVLDGHRAMVDRELDDRDLVERVAALGEVLAAQWRAPLLERLS